MPTFYHRPILVVIIVLLASMGTWLVRDRAAVRAAAGAQAAVGSVFTYQGRLAAQNAPANGSYDLSFKLFTADVGGAQLGDTVSVAGQPVTDGLFTVQLDFGRDVFKGAAPYLEIAVRAHGSMEPFTTLTPRQMITAAPYALHAGSASALHGQPLSGAAPTDGQVLAWNGSQWSPQSAQGEPGATGPQGPQGAKSLLLTSVEAPGASCATGGTKIQAGLDLNDNGSLDPAEIDARSTRFVCNGAQGPQGATGPQGPQGSAGALGVYGDGSAGALAVPAGTTLDLSTANGFNTLIARGQQHLQFTTINIAGTLIVPSGVTLRATGNVTISGSIEVLPGTQDVGGGPPHPGLSLAPAGSNAGGVGLSALSASLITRPPAAACGAGERAAATSSGGEGGGALVIVARGNLTVSAGGSIHANGGNSVNPFSSADVAGGGGGAGGVIVLGAQGNITVAGVLRANGGPGANGVNGNGGTVGAGGGGGGGGGIVHLIAASSPTITGTVQTFGGAGGADAFGSTSSAQGGGGGACGGNGGTGGSQSGGVSFPSQAGANGYSFTTVVPSPEHLFQ